MARKQRGLLALALVALITATTACTGPALDEEGVPPDHQPQVAFASSPPSVAPDPKATTVTQAALSADVSSTGQPLDLSRILNASQGGYPIARNLNWLPSEAAQLSSMGLKEIRIDHVFDEFTYHVVRKDESGQISYDFTALDAVLLPLASSGLQPFLTLSYMPPALGGSRHGPPDSMAAWSDAVTALVSHYRDLGYTGWGFEVWNEVDTHAWESTIGNYNELYAASAAAVKAADSTALVGGAAASGIDSAGNWSGQFIEFLGANPLVPADFFSVHAYRSDVWAEAPVARQLLDTAGRAGLPIYITEWNNVSIMDQGAGNGSDTNSSVSGSSYIAKRLFRAIGSEAAKFYYFSPLEGYKFNLPYNGDLGLVTVDGHRKSAGNVFQMYSQLESTLLPATITGDGSEAEDVYGLVTKNKKGTSVSALLWNNTAVDSEMALSIEGLPFKKTNFRVQQKEISGTLGNGFADGSSEVAPVYPSANENAPITSDASMKPAEAYTDQVIVPAHGVVSISITPSHTPVGEIDRSAEPPQTNLAAVASGALVTASSSVERADQGWGVARLSDGRRHSVETSDAPIRGWSSESHPESSATESVELDLGAAKSVDTVVLWPRDSQTHDGAGFPDDFTIQGSADGITWDTLATAVSYSKKKAPTGPQTFEFAAAEYQFLKVEATALTDGARDGTPSFAFQLNEFEAYRNGVPNGGFESGTLDGWTPTGKASVQSLSIRGGQHAVVLSGKASAVSTLITGLLPNTTYTFGGHARPETRRDAATITVSGFGGAADVSVKLLTPQWAAGWVTFTTGAKNTSAAFELSKAGGKGNVWADDFVLTQGETGPPPAK